MKVDVLCAGELLMDLISDREAASLDDVTGFAPVPGGSPANLATNLQHLGVHSALVACVGRDAFGQQLLRHVRESGLDAQYVSTSSVLPSTLVTVTRSKTSPSFEVYRGADQALEWSQFQPFIAQPPRVFHTTCFALSGLPARSHLLRAGRVLAKAGVTLSIDANYAAKVWPDRKRAQRVVQEYLSQGALVKMSEVDFERLYEQPLTIDNCEVEGQRMLGRGARLVCFTFGGDGACVISPSGIVRLSPKPVTVVDSTGAGDSFWSGFLAAYLSGASPERCLQAGIGVAAVKLQQLGPLSTALDWRTV